MKSLRIGLLIVQEGPPAIWAPSAQACADLAVHELNRQGGVQGRAVDLVVVDAGPTWRSAAEAARECVDEDQVDAIVGMLPSYARSPVAFAIDGRAPFIYTPQFEGFEGDGRIVTTGETAAELLRPALHWLAEHKHARSFFLCGSDYIWPRTTCAVARNLIQGMGARTLGEMFLKLDPPDFEAVIEAIRRTRPDVVVPYFLGADLVRFNRAFAEAGLHRTTLRYTSGIDETLIYGTDEDATENLYASSAYFGAVRTKNNQAFLERYHTLHGETPPPASAFGQSCYEGVHCLAALVEASGGLTPAHLRAKVGRTRLPRTARGGEVAGGRHPIYFAQAQGYAFEVISQAV
jgi:ABC-type branched-subunit amino acid transport system substrate-binding protein